MKSGKEIIDKLIRDIENGTAIWNRTEMGGHYIKYDYTYNLSKENCKNFFLEFSIYEYVGDPFADEELVLYINKIKNGKYTHVKTIDSNLVSNLVEVLNLMGNFKK